MPRALLGLMMALLLLATACPRIEEPWVREDNPLMEERGRSPEQQQVLRHRFMWIQTDR